MIPTPTIPTFRLPGLIASIGGRLPQWPNSLSLAAAMNVAKLLRLLPEESLHVLEDRRFRVSVLDTGAVADIVYSAGVFRPLLSANDLPDLSFSADLAAYLQLLSRQEDPDTLFFNRHLLIEGDTELGLAVKNMLDAIDWSRLPLPSFLRRSG